MVAQPAERPGCPSQESGPPACSVALAGVAQSNEHRHTGSAYNNPHGSGTQDGELKRGGFSLHCTTSPNRQNQNSIVQPGGLRC